MCLCPAPARAARCPCAMSLCDVPVRCPCAMSLCDVPVRCPCARACGEPCAAVGFRTGCRACVLRRVRACCEPCAASDPAPGAAAYALRPRLRQSPALRVVPHPVPRPMARVRASRRAVCAGHVSSRKSFGRGRSRTGRLGRADSDLADLSGRSRKSAVLGC